MSKKIEMLNEKAKEIRKLTVKTIGGLGVGHIGGAVSICEVLAALYFDVTVLYYQKATQALQFMPLWR